MALWAEELGETATEDDDDAATMNPLLADECAELVAEGYRLASEDVELDPPNGGGTAAL